MSAVKKEVEAETGTSLIVLESLVPEKIFAPGGTDELMAVITAEVAQFSADHTKPEGQKAIKALRNKIRSSRTGVEKIKLEHTEVLRKRVTEVNDEAKRFEIFCKEQEETVMADLDAWTAAEKVRIDGHKDAIAEINALGVFAPGISSEDLEGRRLKVGACWTARDWEDYAKLAEEACNAALATINEYLPIAQKREQDEAELAALRAAQAERDRKDAEEKAAAAAVLAAKEKADADIKAAEVRAAQAEERERLAKEDAERKAADAVRAEQDRVAREKAAEEAAAAKRAADTAHRAKINNEAVDGIVAAGDVSRDVAIAILKAIVSGAVPHIKVEY